VTRLPGCFRGILHNSQKPGRRAFAPSHENPAGVGASEEGIVINRVDHGAQAWRNVHTRAAPGTACPA